MPDALWTAWLAVGRGHDAGQLTDSERRVRRSVLYEQLTDAVGEDFVFPQA